jgi:hypothetical protein
MVQSFVLAILLFSLPVCVCYSQNEATHWCFGHKAGFRFSRNGPNQILACSMNAQHGSAVMSDKNTGELLFYTNGRNVWNRHHARMPHSRDFPEDCWSSITQSALIVPHPGDDTKYYIFAIYLSERPGGDIFIRQNCDVESWYEREYYCDLRYSLLDVTLDGGLGDIVENQKNILLQTDVTHKLTAVPHVNGRDYWIVAHEFNGNGFYAYPLTSHGIGDPVVTHIGSVHIRKPGDFFPDEEARGYMKAFA